MLNRPLRTLTIATAVLALAACTGHTSPDEATPTPTGPYTSPSPSDDPAPAAGDDSDKADSLTNADADKDAKTGARDAALATAKVWVNGTDSKDTAAWRKKLLATLAPLAHAAYENTSPKDVTAHEITGDPTLSNTTMTTATVTIPTDDRPLVVTVTRTDQDADWKTTAIAASNAPEKADSDQSPLETFAQVWADDSLSDKQWLAKLKPVTTPALYASLTTTDRSVATGTGHDVLRTTDTTGHVGHDDTEDYSVSLAQPVADAAGEPDTGPLVSGIRLPEDTPGALPLDTDARAQLTKPTLSAFTALIAQPGGLTDKQRAQRITDTFTKPAHAKKIKRKAGEEASIRIGGIHEFSVHADDQDRLTVRATVPYAPDGHADDDTKWQTLTITMTRTDDGAWTPQDAQD